MDEPPNIAGPSREHQALDPQTPATRTRHERNHLLWTGPLLTFVAAVSYFTVFTKFPALRDFPWVNLPLVLLGLLLSFWGVRRAFDGASVYRGKIMGPLGLVLAALIGGMFCWYIFYYSYTVPEPRSVTLNLQAAPDFELPDQNGRQARLSDFRGQRVILVFYRGFW